jgi:NAD(P)-dependent dehydrogenase (short-subunit alcohol dehydrogenase family)
LSLEGQTAIVTGARRGIGRDTALVLAEAGADVVVCDLVDTTGELKATADEIKKMGRRAVACHCDVTKADRIDEMVQKAVDTFGKIDILVNNAGIGSGEGPTEADKWEERSKEVQERFARRRQVPMISMFDEDNWNAVLGTNLGGVLRCSRAVSGVMIKNRRGAIVNVSSVMAYSKGGSAFSAYSVSKRGIVMVTEGLAADLARYNIRVNAIAPGGIETEMMRYVWAFPERLQMLESKILLGGKLLKPLSCAHLIYFLVSDLSQYVTGQTIVVDGGLTLAPNYA